MSRDPTEPLLSSEETDALLEAMRAGGELQAEADPVDLTAPDRPLREALSKADRTAQMFSKEVKKFLLRGLGWQVGIEPTQAEITPFSVLVTSLAPGTAVATLGTVAGSAGMLVVGPSITSCVLDRLLGAPINNDEIQAVARPDLTALDRRVLHPFMVNLCDVFTSLWTEHREALFVDHVLSRPSDAPMRTQFEPMLRIGVRVTPPGAEPDEVVIALTSSAVMATVPRAPEEPAIKASPRDREMMAIRIAATDIAAIAVLGTTRSNVREILTLRAGDVIRLGSVPNQPIDIAVGGVPVLRGMPVVEHGNLAVEVTEVLKPKGPQS